MTRDEVRELIANSIATVGVPEADTAWVNMFLREADAVLAAFAARGIVLGTVADLTADEWEQLNVSWLINEPPCKAVIAKVPDLGLALVRVVPND